jgi:2-polyprenyl-6-methoxyphenol hydroxylase-like FAD-dependent oxidoreductase
MISTERYATTMRFIHSKMGITNSTPEKAIRAVDRGGLNKHLLDVLESMPNVTLFFNHKLTGADFQRNAAWFEVQKNIGDNPRPIEIEVNFDFLIGADGAHSATRYHLMKFVRMSYQQTYIDTLWCEFRIPPRPEEEGGGWRLSEGHLHIWPGKRFMFIAIPSLVSMTPTLKPLPQLPPHSTLLTDLKNNRITPSHVHSFSPRANSPISP